MLGSDPIQFNEGDDDLQLHGESHTASSTDRASSNRPAANANLSETVDATSEEFQFQDEADDFLGLEGEVEALEAAAGGSSSRDNFNVNESGDLDLSEGWLLEVATEENSTPTTRQPSGNVDSAQPHQIEKLVSTAIHSTEVGEQAFDTDMDADEYGDDEFEEYDEELDGEHGEAAAPRSKKLVLVGFCAGILGMAGLLTLDTDTPDVAPGTQVAQGIKPAPVQPTNTATENTAAENATTELAENTAEAETAEPIEDVLVGLMGAPSEGAAGETVEPINFDAQPDPMTTPESVAGMPGLPSMPEFTPSEVDLSAQANAPRSILTKLAQGAENGDISGFMEFAPTSGSGFIWTGEEVPTESISTQGRILTPAVGVVRATMNSGELFEGNLYAVGSDRVWIEMGPGRVGLDGKKIQKIERVVAESVESEKLEAALGQRVRIRAAGGVLYGKVKSREGNRVTIITDKGARITLLDPEIEAIGRLSGLVLN